MVTLIQQACQNSWRQYLSRRKQKEKKKNAEKKDEEEKKEKDEEEKTDQTEKKDKEEKEQSLRETTSAIIVEAGPTEQKSNSIDCLSSSSESESCSVAEKSGKRLHWYHVVHSQYRKRTPSLPPFQLPA